MKKFGKKFLVKKFLIPFLLSNFFLLITLFVVIISVLTMFYMEQSSDECGTDSENISITNTDDGTVPASIDEFINQHKEAYILSWKAGGFLPSASISQTMVENGFNFTNPSGTSFWKAHNMGGGTTRFSISVEIAK